MEATETAEGWAELAWGWLAVQGINIVVGILILLAGWWIARLASRVFTRWTERSQRLEPLVEKFLSSLVYYGLLALVVIIALNMMGVQTASLIAVLGAASLAIGLALQGSLTSLAAGIMIITMRPFKLGDYIEVSGSAGTVKSITLFITELATYDGIQKLLPNSEVWGSTVTNYSVYPTRLLDINVGVDYADDIDEGLAVLKNLAERTEKVLPEPAPDAFVSDLGESSVDLTLRVFVPASDYFPLKRFLTKMAKVELEKAGLSIPFPHRQVVPAKGGPAPGDDHAVEAAA
jgi:small conductance mechanosensitive channel